MADAFDISKYDINKNYVLQASAGTGKTFSIVKIVEKLLDAGVKLNEILLVTYTEKAAGELKDRIRNNQDIRKKNSDIDDQVDNALIGTIHSFCQKVIEEYCVASGKPSKLNLVSDTELSDYIEQYIRQGNIYKVILEIKSLVPPMRVEEKLIKTFSLCLNKYYLNRNYIEVPDIVSLDKTSVDMNFVKDFIAYNSNHKAFIADKFPDLNKHLDVLKNSTNTKKTTLNKNPAQIKDKLYCLYELLKDSDDLYYNGTVFKSNKDMTYDENDAMEYISSAKKTISKLKNLTMLIPAIVMTYLEDLYRGWQVRKEQLNQQTYNDMLRNVRENIISKDSLLKEKLKQKFKYGIIDEFQDTNQVQWDIFSRVFLDDANHHIIVVGDPKQSIYSFQGADLTVYEKAIKEIEATGGLYLLDTNYRATEDIVSSTNDFFDNPDAINNFSHSKCGWKKMSMSFNNKTVPAYWIYDKADTSEECSESSPNQIPNDYLYAKAVCECIVDFCTIIDKASGRTKLMLVDKDGKERSVSFKDFAILARTSTEMPPIERTLEKCGVPYVRYKDASLFTSRECAQWIALLDAIDTPDFTGENRVKFRKALYTIFFGRSLEEIKSESFDNDNIPEILIFEKWKQLASENKWEEMIDAIMLDTALGGRMRSLKYLKSYGVMKQLGEYCIDYLAKSSSITSLVKNLRKRQERIYDESGAEDDGIVAKGTDFNSVKIMTIHAAKGLEFPIVISMAGFKAFPPNDTGLITYHDSNKYLLSFSEDDAAKGKAEFEQEEELKRLMYVLYTRAQYILMLPEFFEEYRYKKQNVPKMIHEAIFAYKSNPAYMYQPFCESSVSYADLKNRVKDIINATKVAAPSNVVQLRQDQLDKLKSIIKSEYWYSAYKYTYSSLSHDKEDKQLVGSTGLIKSNGEEENEMGLSEYDEKAKQIKCAYNNKQDPVKVSENYPAGAELGNALHEALEVADYVDFNTKDYSNLISEHFTAQGFNTSKYPEWIKDSKEMLSEVVQAIFPVIHGSEAMDESFKLSEITFENRKNEVEFNFNKDGEQLHRFFNGFVDMIFRRGEYFSVLDWKSDRLNDDFTSYSDADQLKKHVSKLYSIQRVLYSYCLIIWLKQFYNESEEEIFNKHFGGVYYVFLRGCNADTGNGIYAQTWNSFNELKDAYNNIVSKKIK